MVGQSSTSHANPTILRRQSRRASRTILGGLGSSRSESFSGKNPEGGTPVAFLHQTPFVTLSHGRFFLPRQKEEFTAERGCGQYARQGSYCPSFRCDNTRFLQPTVSCSQENRRLETGNGPFHLEQTPSYSFVQDGNGRVHPRLPSPRPVGNVPRFVGRLLPHSYGYLDPQVPLIYGTWGNVPFPSSSLRVSNSTQGVHRSSQGGQENSSETPHSSFPVHRRLAEPGRVLRLSSSEYLNSSQTDHTVRLDCERREIGSCSNSGVSIPGLHVRSSEGSSLSTREKISRPVGNTSSSSCLSSDNSTTLNVSAGSHGLHGENGTVGTSSHETGPIRAEETMGTKGNFIPRSQDHGIQRSTSSPTVVVQSEQCYGNDSTTGSNPIHIHLHGCLSGGMGCPHGSIHGPRILDRSGGPVTFKSQGTQSSFSEFESAASIFQITR